MPGSADLNPAPVSLSGSFIPVIVARYLYRGPEADEEQGPYEIVPNVRCLQIDYREGPEPPVARFQYVMDDFLQTNLRWPAQFEKLWPIDAQGDHVIKTDDQLTVLTLDPDGNPIVLFNGFAQVPQIDVQDNHQGVTFAAIGVAIRLWDDPITTRVQRSTDKLDTTDGSEDIEVDLPCRFNPATHSMSARGGYLGNATTTGEFTEARSISTFPNEIGAHPVFVDPLVTEINQGGADYWFLSDCLKYLFATHLPPLNPAEEPWVTYPGFGILDQLLDTYSPEDDDSGTINQNGATATDLQIRDYDASNKPLPDVVADLLSYGGYTMSFFCDTDADGLPFDTLNIYRRDSFASKAPKPLYLAASGSSSLDLTANNASSFHIARDCNQIVNEFDVETELKQVEITVLLNPGFQFNPADNDKDPGNIGKWDMDQITNASATSADRRKYRWWVADECGDGHMALDNGPGFAFTWVTDHPLDFSDVFPPTQDDDGNDIPSYVTRYRPGRGTMISRDSNGEPLRARLDILFSGQDTNDPPVGFDHPSISSAKGLADNGYVFQNVPSGWKLLDDRLGIELNCLRPNEWNTGMGPAAAGTNNKPHKVSVIDWLNDTSSPQNNTFVLALTTVIDSDKRMAINSPKRVSSPTKYSRSRSSDGKDHFQYCTIDISSLNYPNQKDAKGEPPNDTDPLVCRDDTKSAQSHADQLRSAHEFPRIAGSVTIPYWTDYYKIADQVKILQGRNASFQINVGVDQGEAPCYPWVTAFTWMFENDRQETVLQLSDRRAEPRNL